MKKMKKKIFTASVVTLCAVMLVVGSVWATLAYLTSSAAVSNVFTVGDVKLHMYETKVTPDGKPVTVIPAGEMKNTDTNSYHLVPGGHYTKDPTIYVDGGSEESYLFVRLRNDLKTIEKQGDPDNPTILEQLKKKGWLEIERAASNVDAVFVYVGEEVTQTADQFFAADKKAKLVGGVDERVPYDVFESFTLADKVDNLTSFGGARVAIVAYAIQANLPGYNDSDEVGTKEAVTHAWEYIKSELPFVV